MLKYFFDAIEQNYLPRLLKFYFEKYEDKGDPTYHMTKFEEYAIGIKEDRDMMV